VIRAQGRDARGNGTAAATVTAVLIAEGDTTKVAVTTDLDITGKPAQFGRGVMADVGNKLIGQFADCLAGQLSGGDAFGATATPDAPTDELPAASADAPTVQLPAASDEPAAAAGAPTAASDEPAASAGVPAKKAPAKKAAAKKAPAKKVAAASTAGPSTATEAVNGSAPAAESAAAQPAAEPAPQPAAAAPRPIAPRDVEPIDLMHSAGPAVAKRLAPLLGGLLLLLIVLRLIRRR
jgi:hypothetical protein